MTEVMSEDDIVCRSCTSTVDIEDSLLVFGEFRYCTDCGRRCDACNSTTLRSELETIGNQTVCGDCRYWCIRCDNAFLRDQVQYSDYHDDWSCASCAPYLTRDSDEYSGIGDGTIRDYGHTSGWLWLGGPVKDEGGYYLGIELEVWTDNLTAVPIMDWGEEHLGNREAMIGKEDSSVEGFEIVSQPMTPEFFESVDWDSFFTMLNENYPTPNGEDEPIGHGLHVHIGRAAFNREDISIAAYAYLLSQSEHLERIGRRPPTGYCMKVKKPVSTAILGSKAGKDSVQKRRLSGMGYHPGRDAINLLNHDTVEIRAFKSTRKASELRDAVRVTYVAAEYVRSLRTSPGGVSGRALHWSEFCRWVAVNKPEAFAGISGLNK